jgi:hypothetical protein
MSKILFVSENRSWDIAEEALRSGSGGYVVKADAARDLLPAVKSVLQGKQFVSARFAGRDLIDLTHAHRHNYPYRNNVDGSVPLRNVKIARHHEVGFYSDDRWLLEDVTQFIGTALKAGNAAIIAATESHRNSLFTSLRAYGVDVGAAIEQGQYSALDAAEVLSTFMLNGMPDPVRFMKAFGDLILSAAAVANSQDPRVAIFGECVHLLWAEGNAEAAVRVEKLGNELVNAYDIDIRCGYSLHTLHDRMDGDIYQRICGEHSAVHSR